MVNVFRAMLAVAWVILLWVTVSAGQQLGFDKAGDFFFGDMAHPWRAQFNTDFGFHLLLVAAWMVWSAKNRVLGILFGVLSIMGGGLFTFVYLLIASIKAHGDMRAVALGRHFQS